MDLKRIRYQYEEFDWFSYEGKLLENPCECGIKPPGAIINVFSLILKSIFLVYVQ